MTETNQIDAVEEFKKVVAHICADEHGIIFFRWLMEELGYQKTSIEINPASGEVLKDRMMMNEANRNMWLRIAAFIPVEKRAEIELLTSLKQLEVIDTSTPRRENTWQMMHQLLSQTQLPKAPNWEKPPEVTL